MTNREPARLKGSRKGEFRREAFFLRPCYAPHCRVGDPLYEVFSFELLGSRHICLQTNATVLIDERESAP